MSEKSFMCGNEALAQGAILAGCDAYFGYPITPQNEVCAYMAREMPARGRVFVQSESELAAINMVMGAAATGARAMTSSSSPGISLMQESISYLAGCNLPAVIVNVMRGGPGLGSIGPSQADYWQATRGGGHGDYRTPVLAPAGVQDMADFMHDAFDIADRYRTPVMVLADGVLGQMMEPVEFHQRPPAADLPAKDWALTGAAGREHNVVLSLFIDGLEDTNRALHAKYTQIEKDEVRVEQAHVEDADIVVVAYGICYRVVRAAVTQARREGIRAGYLRPITLWPFPKDALGQLVRPDRQVLVVELSFGQMVEDVQLTLNGRMPVTLHGRGGDTIPSVPEVLEQIRRLAVAVES